MNQNTGLQLTGSSNKAIPNGWIWTTVGQISHNIQYGYTASATDSHIGPKFLRITDIQDNGVNWNTVPYCKIDSVNAEKYLLRTGDLLFARTGATVGKSYLIYNGVPYSIFASYSIRIVLSDLINKKYIGYFFQSALYWNQIMEKRIGTGQPNVNGNILSKLSVPIPPISEQNRIVSKIEELFIKLDASIHSLKKTKSLLKQYRESVFKYAFKGKLTEKWRGSHSKENEPASTILEKINKEHKKENSKEGFQFSSSWTGLELSDLPVNWIWTRIGNVFQIIMGQSPPGSSYNTRGEGIPLLNGPTEFGMKYPIPMQWTNSPTKLSDTNDLLICVRGNTTGKMNWSDRHYCIGRGLAAIRPRSSEINTEILFYFLKMKVNELMSYTTGSTFPNLKSDELKGFAFPLIPIIEQNIIVKEIKIHFSLADNVENVIEQSLSQAERLHQSILKIAFEGKLISQDPTDEPVSMLLQRIKTEKSKQQILGKANKKTNKINNSQMRLV